MQAVSLLDVVHIGLANEDRVTSTHLDLPSDTSNLVYRAVECFRLKTGLCFPVDIHIEKKIPIGGGCGGGSSNVATTLWGLNLICGNIFSQDMLRTWAGMVSCDAPFFFSSGTAYATGRGENIKNLPPLRKKYLYLAVLNRGISTSMVYRQCTPSHFGLLPDPLHQLESVEYVNDLEASAFTLCPTLAAVKQRLLYLGFKTVAMTGSGSSFFCLGPVEHLSVPGIELIPISFLSRTENGWYTCAEHALAIYGHDHVH